MRPQGIAASTPPGVGHPGRRRDRRRHGRPARPPGLGGLARGGHRLRQQPDQPGDAPVRAGQGPGRPGRPSWWRCTTAPAPARPSTPAPSSPRWPTSTASSSSTRRPPGSGNCFDVSSPGALRHDGNSDPAGIVSMVVVVQHRNGDASRVFVTGASSGAMMTNVLLGDYPDVFQAGAAFAGVPFGCFATTDGRAGTARAPTASIIRTPQQWGDLVRAAYPGLHRSPAADAAVARHQGRHPALPQLRRGDQAVDQRARPEPDPDR